MATFRERMATRLGASTASAASNNVENWDDDGDFEGTLFTHSMSTIQSSMSSRVSVRSESNTGDEEWQLLLAPNDDDLSTTNAISAAKRAGIPIPNTAPSSALLGGAIKRLGTKKSNRKINVDDDWGNDLVLPENPTEGLKLKAPMPHTPADDNDDLDWGEGSLGIRFAGTRRDTRGGRSSSVSAMSPSMGSCMTLESEDDDLTGLILPNEPLDFNARLEKLKRSEPPTPDVSPLPGLQKREPPPTSAPTSLPRPDFSPSPAPLLKPSPILDRESRVVPTATPPLQSEPVPAVPEPKLKPVQDEEDFLDGLDFGGDEVLDTKKLTLNRNVVVKKPASKSTAPPAARPATTITFTDKPAASRIPRPLSTSRSRLTPVYESGASTLSHNRPMPTTTSAQLLRAKRSAPLLRNTNYNVAPRTQVPFLPAGGSSSQSHHVMAKSSQTHLRRDSDPRRPQSPAMRSYSRMSGSHQVETPSRTGVRRDLAPSALGRHSLPQKITQPQGRKKNYGDGSELELFDDLPTSATKEKQYEKVPRNVPSNKSLRTQPSNSRLPTLDRMSTPLPQTPRSPTKMDNTPRFARDTAASRNAREQRLAGTRSRGEGPIAPRLTNWQAQIAARSPRTSPTAHRKRGSGQKPHLIKPMSQPHAKNEKGMVYNPTLQRWEGNEDALVPFSQPNTSTTTLALTTASTPTFAPPNHPFHYSHDRSHSISHTALSHIQAAQKNVSSRAVKVAPAPSPPRPALISQISAPRGVQYEGRMVFDPVKMTWMKAPRLSNDPRSPSVDMDDEEDPFAGLDDLKDNESVAGTSNAAGGATGNSGIEDPSFIGEEFDLGPSFIRRQREEEAIWRRKVEGWVGGLRDSGEQKGGWRWAIREFAASASAENFRG